MNIRPEKTLPEFNHKASVSLQGGIKVEGDLRI